MAKFCKKCGANIENAGNFCPKCGEKIDDVVQQVKEEAVNNNPATPVSDDKNVQDSNVQKESDVKPKKGKMNIAVKIAIIVAILLCLSVGTIAVLQYFNVINIPVIESIFNSDNDKTDEEKTDEDKTQSDAPDTEGDNESDDVTSDDDADLSQNYEVPEFDAEDYFDKNTELKTSFDVQTSADVSTESEAFDNFSQRGFDGYQVTYDYTIEGEYVGNKVISNYSSARHPMYQTNYMTESGDIWMVFEINGAFFATPLSYNFENETKVPVLISETDTITSYDSTTNKFYVNIPEKSESVIKKVAKIDAETLEKLTGEEIDKL